MPTIKSPEIERQELKLKKEKFDVDEKIEEYLKQIRRNPYKYICDYAESVYPHIGKETFQVLSLVPISLLSPDLPFMGKKVRSNINVLFLAASGAGKTSIAKLFGSFTINALEIESITVARLEETIRQNPKFTLIVGDFTRMAKEPIMIKVLEGVLGEEKRISRKTMRKDLEMETDGAALLCGTPQDLSHYLSGGLLFRLVPIIIIHDHKKHADIGNHIVDRIGEESYEDIIEEAIKTYYQEIEYIQEGKHPDIKPITGYVIDKRFKKKGEEEWERLATPIVKATNFNFLRSLQELFRFMINHAVLNLHNRKIVDGKIYINEEDFEIGIKLMSKTIQVQYDILKTERFAKSLRNLSELQAVLNSKNIDQKYKDYLKYMAKVKHGRITTK